MTPVSNPGLARTQRWLQKFIMAPGTASEALAAPAVRKEFAGEVAELVTPSRTLTSEQRAGVYRGMYLARLGEALRNDYPVVGAYLGKEQFDRLVEGYVDEYPSRSYTLNRLGDHLPRYLAEAPGLQRRGLLVDLARFELLITEVFDEAQDDALDQSVIKAVPPDDWGRAVLQPVSAFRLGRFDYPVDRFKEAYRDERDYPAGSKAETFVAIYRRDYRVYWIDLDEAEHFLLQRLADGETLGSGIEHCCLEKGVAEDQIFSWFQGWIRNQLFRSVEIS